MTTIDQDLNFLLNSFVVETEDALHAQAVSADGMHLAASTGMARSQLETFAAITAGLASLTDSAVDNFGAGSVVRQVIEASRGWILIQRISVTASIGVHAHREADLGFVGYEMARLAKQLTDVLSPDVIDKLKNTLAV